MKTEKVLKEIKRQIVVCREQTKYLNDLDKRMEQVEKQNEKL